MVVEAKVVLPERQWSNQASSAGTVRFVVIDLRMAGIERVRLNIVRTLPLKGVNLILL